MSPRRPAAGAGEPEATPGYHADEAAGDAREGAPMPSASSLLTRAPARSHPRPMQSLLILLLLACAGALFFSGLTALLYALPLPLVVGLCAVAAACAFD